MTLRKPPSEPRAPFRCKRSLAAAAVVGIGAVLYEIVPVFGSFRWRVRAKVTAAASLDFIHVGPDFDPEQELSGKTFAQLVGTQYATPAITQLALAANTEANRDFDCYGEGYLILKLTGGAGAGAVTFVDVTQLPNAG
jgi:hypothetical protein